MEKTEAQNWDGAGGGSLPTFSRVTLTTDNTGGRTKDDNPVYTQPGPVVIKVVFDERAVKLNKAGIEFWKEKDWEKAARKFKNALAYSPNDENIKSNLNHALAYEESDKADRELQKKDWGIKEIESALKHYKKAQEHLPNDNYINGCIIWHEGLKNFYNRSWTYAIQDFQNAEHYFKDEDDKKKLITNITVASYNQVRELGNKYLSNGDWVNAAAYLYVANKDFSYGRDDAGYSKAYNEVGKISNGYALFNQKVQEIQNRLPAEVKKNW